MLKRYSLILLLFLPHYLHAQNLPDFTANYLVKLNGLQAGELKRTLSSNADGTRLFESQTQAKGVFSFFKPDLVEEKSLWQRHNDIIRPMSYVYKRTGGKKEKYMQLDFDWSTNRVHIDDKHHPWSLKITHNTLDKLVYQLALMSDLADNKKRFSYKIADGGKLKIYTINSIENEIITTPLGRINTVKLVRARDQSNDRHTVLWCAPALNYLPVKLEHIEKGGAVFTAELRRLKGISTDHAFQPITPTHSIKNMIQ